MTEQRDYYEEMCQALNLQDALAWGKLWKRAAKSHRTRRHRTLVSHISLQGKLAEWVKRANRAEIDSAAKDKEIARLREALEFVADVVELRDHAGRHVPANAGAIRELDEVVQAALEATE